ncbi:hypothetical protein G9A89_003247 [Geosiphon pyriformis]|nr:hypothetical protein G9A89_003247 [Geosiphon pyriformis]
MTKSNFNFQDHPVFPRPLPIAPLLSSSAPNLSRVEEPRPLHSYGLNEAINSCSWFPTNPRRLLAGMGGKCLRIYDLRMESSNQASMVPTKAVYGVKIDPFNFDRFASFEEAGTVHLWDDRKIKSRPVRVAFSPQRSGLLAVLEKDSSHLTLWDIQESNSKYLFVSPTLPQRSSSFATANSSTFMAAELARQAAAGYEKGNIGLGYGGISAHTQPIENSEDIDLPILWKSRKIKGSSKPLTSFAWIPTITSASSHRLVSINKDGIIETLKREESLKISWDPRGNMSVASGRCVNVYDMETKGSLHESGNEDEDDGTKIKTGKHYDQLGPQPIPENLYHSSHKLNTQRLTAAAERLKSPSFLSVHHDIETESGNRTPRPGDMTDKDIGMLGNRLHGMASKQQKKVVREERAFEMSHCDSLLSPFRLLNTDISVLMRDRALQRYSMHCRTNEDIVRHSAKLKTLWNWIAEAQLFALDHTTHIGNNDFSYYGIHTVWQASLSTISGEKFTSSTMSMSKVSQSRFTFDHQESGVGSSSSSISSQIIDTNEIPIVHTLRPAQRKLSLIICGWGFGRKELEETLVKMENSKEFEKAAAWALFHGWAERAIKALNNSRNERLKLISTALAGYAIHNQDETYQASPLWREMCKNLSLEMRDPYLRAMFSYIASGQWSDVLHEEGLSLSDRIGIALRFLDDERLDAYIRETTARVVHAGDIEGVVLTGLTPEGVNLFENYVNNTGDVQTASLALSFCVPRRFKDTRVIHWVESYRQLLDQWEMFHHRARFDIERGKHVGPNHAAAADMIPPQVSVRCNFCNHSIAHNTRLPSSKGKEGKSRQGFNGATAGPTTPAKTTCCPDCRLPLPRCSICLLNLGTPIDSLRAQIPYNQDGHAPSSTKDGPAGFDLWFTWCQTCRHGGHAIHILQWFQKHKYCPVSDCSCQCSM